MILSSIVFTSRLAQLVERVTSNDEVSRSSRLMGICSHCVNVLLHDLSYNIPTAQVAICFLHFSPTNLVEQCQFVGGTSEQNFWSKTEHVERKCIH